MPALRLVTPIPSAASIMSGVVDCLKTADSKPSYLMLHLRAELPDIWQFLHENISPWSTWHDGQEGRSCISYGYCWQESIHSSTPFHDALQNCRQVTQRLNEIGATKQGPIIFAGFSFFPAGQHLSEHWQNWSRNMMFIPKILIDQRQGETSTISFCWAIHKDDCAEQKSQQIASEAHQRYQMICTPKSVHPSTSAILAQNPQDQTKWNRQISEIQQQISDGNLQKVVQARTSTFQNQEGYPFSAKHSFLRLLSQNPNCYGFAFSPTPNQAFIGAPPETLIRLQNQKISTQALAGTMPRSHDEQTDQDRQHELLESLKNRKEQAFVVTAISDILKPICHEINVASQPHILSLPDLYHLNTVINGVTNVPVHILELIEKLHPTPALGGWPTAQAEQWIVKHEALERGWYGGPVGWIDKNGNGVFCVAIRSALLHKDTAIVYAGAGIVAESNAQSEWKETESKFQTITKALRTYRKSL